MCYRLRTLLIVLALGPSLVQAAEWGDLTMRFVYFGDPPKPKSLETETGGAFCGAKRLVDESLVIDQSDRGIANVLVWLLRDGADVPVHTSYSTLASSAVKIVSRDCRIEPRIAVVQTAQKLHWSNDDPIGHGLKCNLIKNDPFDTLLQSGTSWERQFEKPESQPAPLMCNIHPQMRAYLFIHDSPYASISDSHGRLTIRSMPTGQRTCIMWHEKVGLKTTPLSTSDVAQWSGGRLTLAVKSGLNDLGEIKLTPEMFRP